MSASAYRNIMKSLFEGLQPRSYLEVGCRKGETLRQLMPLARKIGTKMLALDINDVKKHLPKGVKFYHGNSAKIGARWDSPLDMVFIDANHAAKAVWEDFMLFSPWVTTNGIMLLHDTYPGTKKNTVATECGEAWKAAWKIRKECGFEFEIVTIPIVNGLSIIRKSEMQVSWQKTIPATEWEMKC